MQKEKLKTKLISGRPEDVLVKGDCKRKRNKTGNMMRESRNDPPIIIKMISEIVVWGKINTEEPSLKID